MNGGRGVSSPERAAMLQWAVEMGAITAEAFAHRDETSLASARARLGRAAGEGLLRAHRLLVDRPTLYTATPAGVRASGLGGFDPCRVSAGGAQHLIACAHVAAVLERGYPEHQVIGERELRRRERAARTAVASAVLSRTSDRGQLLHRPDLAIWPPSSAQGTARCLPLAVEVELTIKAPRRLAEICRAWARSRHVEGAIYIAPVIVRRALERAIAVAQAGERIVVVALEELPLRIDI